MSQELHDNLWVLIAGFILTTVAGGLLASILQARLWRHQWKAERRVKFEEAARAVFEDVSRLMDKRLFRLSQWRLWIARGDEPRIAIALEDYRAVMREWNDAINRTLSLLQFYFGTAVREQFDFGVGKHFVDAGAMVERLYRTLPDTDERLDAELIQAIERVRAEVYDYNLALLKCMDQMQRDSRPGLLSI